MPFGQAQLSTIRMFSVSAVRTSLKPPLVEGRDRDRGVFSVFSHGTCTFSGSTAPPGSGWGRDAFGHRWTLRRVEHRSHAHAQAQARRNPKYKVHVPISISILYSYVYSLFHQVPAPPTTSYLAPVRHRSSTSSLTMPFSSCTKSTLTVPLILSPSLQRLRSK